MVEGAPRQRRDEVPQEIFLGHGAIHIAHLQDFVN